MTTAPAPCLTQTIEEQVEYRLSQCRTNRLQIARLYRRANERKTAGEKVDFARIDRAIVARWSAAALAWIESHSWDLPTPNPAPCPVWPKAKAKPVAPKRPPMQMVFTTGQVAKHCKVAARTVTKWYDAGRLKGYRIPGSQDRRVPRESLIRFLKDHNMPLGDLEEEELHKVLFIGTEAPFNVRVMKLLPDADAFRLQYAANGFEAGCLLRSFNPDSIVIDLSLGRGESIQLVAGLRKIDARAGTLIVGLAGEDEAEPDSLKGHGFDEVFKRPFDAAKLAQAIRDCAIGGMG